MTAIQLIIIPILTIGIQRCTLGINGLAAYPVVDSARPLSQVEAGVLVGLPPLVEGAALVEAGAEEPVNSYHSN